MSKLRFAVVACSGEDAAFPAKELNEHASTSKGYMTPKNCEYPQEIVLKLQDGRSRVTQVQLLSHQTHIATKIELFLSSSNSLQDATFQRLGYLTLKSNVESNYMARELKTVHINNEATFVKLLLHQCYINERNIYSQVGVMAVNLCGEPLDSQPDELPNQSSGEPLSVPMRSIPKPSQASPANRTDDLAFDLRFDAKTAERIREIQIAKDKAVASEDYDQAKRLKQMEEHLKSIGLQLARLETQKREAVANEDYDLAKRIKDEIAMLEGSVGSNETQPIISQAANTGYVSPSPTYSNGPGSFARSTSRSQVLPRAGAAAITGTKGLLPSPNPASSSSNFSPRDMYPDDVSGRGRNNGSRHNEESPARSNSHRDLPEDDEDGDEAPVRGGGGSNGGPNPNFRGIPEAENLPDPEEMPAALENENEELIDVIGLFFARCFYSNLWNHRDAAIRKVTMSFERYPHDALKVVRVCATLVQSGAGDRIAQVSLSAFRLLERLLPFGAKIRRDEMHPILANSATQIVNKLGEPQAKVRDEAAAMLSRMASAKNIGVAFVMSHLTKRSKKPLGIKFLLGRLLVMKDLISQFELQPDTDHSVDGIMSFMEDSNCFGHQSKEIRDVAKDITVALYLLIGPDVEGYLKSLRPKQMEEYQAAFEAAETEKAANTRTAAAASKNRGNDRGNDRNSGQGRSQARLPPQAASREDDLDDQEEDDASVDEYTCPFCGVVDDRFDSDGLDQHFWAECRMLTPCKMCGQVIEISGLNEHLLIECEMKKNHKECGRCGEAITAKFYDKHVSLNDCPPRPHPKKANRCPLCHDDIAPGKRGWKRHLLEDTCANNPRSQAR
ncbi:hypothetical protein Poli38472_007834 [Pythium oligandrum]|uniref:TOG domain-containing protein n=1 Tax=Pythium oligandrum TaxID=41045 RepID=A0A8K1FQP4_PYTOL|nr:hypothetical protein Poli38472_007834 [Pythium oligandrum]|eukprot:TMW68162.1 hypothetical protein Poli38472_007834 [Pythium oligandrum]